MPWTGIAGSGPPLGASGSDDDLWGIPQTCPWLLFLSKKALDVAPDLNQQQPEPTRRDNQQQIWRWKQ